MYLLLLEKDPNKKDVVSKAKPAAAQKAPQPAKSAASALKRAAKPVENPNKRVKDGADKESQEQMHGFSPKLHVDIQIHISPDSTPEQIDKIFESMARHLPLKA